MKNKINVNISPNPLDLQTLHCSQNDTGERKFYFTLHNNGEVIDATDISDPIFEPFDVYKGGTEQLLPVNTDDPTTSPIIADIQYPDEEKTEQEFTYRESPTTIDGKALVEKIKGNTLVWNQMAPYIDSSGWEQNNSTTVFSDNEAQCTALGGTWGGVRTKNTLSVKANHKYLVSAEVRALNSNESVTIATGLFSSIVNIASVSSTAYSTYSVIVDNTTDKNVYFNIGNRNNTNSFAVKNVMLFDLTQMFGSTKADEILAMETAQAGSGVAYFKSLFPLPYYQYDVGSLLSFNGTGIKTVGFNQWDEQWELGALSVSNGSELAVNTYMRSKFIPVISGETYCRGINYKSDCRVFFYDGNHAYVGNIATISANTLFTIPNGVSYIRFHKNGATYGNDICINISDSSKNGTYEPYTFSNLDIPTSTYFPTGMKSAGTVYDELTPSKAITRIGEVDLGDLEWTYTNVEGHLRFVSSSMNPEAKTPDVIANAICPKYEIVNEGQVYNNTKVGLCMITNSRAMVYDPNYTDAQTFTTAMSGIYLQYELATEDITEFTHASLICEDGESTLYQDVDSLVCDCTEDFSKDSGFKDCKIKFSKGDGVVYSNKIQLHIERKP